MTGRPSTFTQKIADTVCERLANGESLRAICADDAMPAKSSICKWLGQHKAFADQYARAREAQADALFDEILDIADESANDIVIDGEGNERTNHEVVARSKLRVDARKWMAGKLQPKKYGERIMSELSGPNGGPIETVSYTDEQRAKALENFLARKKA